MSGWLTISSPYKREIEVVPGFIPGSRGSFMLDLVAVAMLAILPAVAVAVKYAKRGSYRSHKTMMLVLSTILLVAVVAFELEMRFIGWTHLAAESPYSSTLLPYVLGVHICCSVTAAVFLPVTILSALKRFPVPPRPSPYSPKHRSLGKISVVSLAATSVTGWLFYWMAFIATV